MPKSVGGAKPVSQAIKDKDADWLWQIEFASLSDLVAAGLITWDDVIAVLNERLPASYIAKRISEKVDVLESSDEWAFVLNSMSFDRVVDIFKSPSMSADGAAAILCSPNISADKADSILNNFSSDQMIEILSSPNMPVDRAATILNSANITADSAATILNSMPVERATGIIGTGLFSYSKLKSILTSANLSDTRVYDIINALASDYVQSSGLSTFYPVKNYDGDRDGSVSISGNTFTISDGGGTSYTYAHCYYKPEVVKSGSVLFISSIIGYNKTLGNAIRAGFGVTLRDSAGSLHTVVISGYSNIGYYGYTGDPESVASVHRFVHLPTSAGLYEYKAVIGLPWDVTEITAVFVGGAVIGYTIDITFESGAVGILPASGKPSSVEVIKYTVIER